MTTVWVVDIDNTIADGKHREHLLTKNCISCFAAHPHNHAGGCTLCGVDLFKISTKSWQRFTDPTLLALDEPVRLAQDILRKAASHGIEIHYITGRMNGARLVTQTWLENHFGFDRNSNKLLMRDTDSYVDGSLHLSASQHKEIKFKQLVEMCGYTEKDSFYFYDDDQYVLPMYAKYGITFHAPECWQVMTVKAPHSKEPLMNK